VKRARLSSSRQRLVEAVRGCEQGVQALLKGKRSHLHDLLHDLHANMTNCDKQCENSLQIPSLSALKQTSFATTSQ